MPAALLFLSADIPFLYYSSLYADTNDGFPSTVGSARHLGFVVIVPWPLTSRWCANWLELTRHGGFGEVLYRDLGISSSVYCLLIIKFQ